MIKSVPSMVVAYIDTLLAENPDRMKRNYWSRFRVLEALIEGIPSSCLGQHYLAVAKFRFELLNVFERWARGDDSSGAWIEAGELKAFRRVIVTCSDADVPESTPGLAFIGDEAYREELRADMASAERSLANHEWKASTVLAGSVIEALLLNALLGKLPGEREHLIASGMALAKYISRARSETGTMSP